MLATKIIIEGITELYHHKKAIFKTLFIPILVIFILGILADKVSVSIPFIVALLIINTLFGAYIAIAMHRTILLAEVPVALKPRHFIVYIQCLLGMLIIFAPAIALHLIPYISLELGFIPSKAKDLVSDIGLALAVIFVSLAMTGYCLILPSVAIDKDLPFATTWEISKKHLVTLLICVAMVAIVTSIPEYLLRDLLGLNLIANLYSWLVFVVEIAILSVAYRTIVNPNCGTITPQVRG
ncbi:MAG: hypothetical protein QGG88_05740 [Gammaproteobacteria bacterium]|jgi:hypothetical protein|nr:hypothetical protein [Gammaproteobacteria bacterium]